VHSTLIAFGYQVPMADLFGLAGRKLLAGLDIPEPWRGHVDASLELIDDLGLRISRIEAELKRSGADHRYVPLLMSAPGFGWITSFTVACEIGDIGRFSSPVKPTGYTGLCPRVKQSGDMDQRGPLSKHGPRYPRWGLMEAAIHAASHPLYKERYAPPERLQYRVLRRRQDSAWPRSRHAADRLPHRTKAWTAPMPLPPLPEIAHCDSDPTVGSRSGIVSMKKRLVSFMKERAVSRGGHGPRVVARPG
jgi:hypothetical protein